MSMRRRTTALVFGLVACATVLAEASPAFAEQEEKVEWSPTWPRVRLWEGLNILALTIGSYVINAYVPVATSAKWQGPILFDKPVRDLLKGGSRATEQTAGDVSDYIYKGAVLAPYVIDNYIVALGVHQNPDVAFQMTLINLQSLGIAGVVSLGAEHLVGRARPYVSGCTDNRNGANVCGTPGDFESFYSGHTAAVMTMAGLTCAHHQHLPLYGGGAPDALACAFMITAATGTGVLRIVADRHYASDVLTGAAVGFVAGYVLPSWLHYGFGDSRKKPKFKTTMGNVAPVPQVYPGGAGLGFVGIF